MKKKDKIMRDEVAGLLLIIMATFGIGLQAVFVKLCFAKGLASVSILVLRKLIFLPFLLAYLFMKMPSGAVFGRVGKDTLLALPIGALGFYVFPSIVFQALRDTEAGLVFVLVFTYPFFVIVFNAILQKIVPPFMHLITFLVMQLGIFLVIGGGSGVFKENFDSASMTLFAAFIFAIYTVMMHMNVVRLGTLRHMFFTILGGLIAASIHFAVTMPFSALLVDGQSLVLLTAYTFSCFVPATLIVTGVQKIGTARASLIASVAPFLTIIFAYFILGETLLPMQLLGGVVVIGAIFVLEKNLLRLFIPKSKKAKISPIEPHL